MTWIYLSPHLDDVVLSCGGIIREQLHTNEAVEIWTICAGDPVDFPLSPLALELHARWNTGIQAVAARRQEDIAACKRLGAKYRHFNIPDCIYRRNPLTGAPLIPENDLLFQPLPAVEYPLMHLISQQIRNLLPQDAQLVSPLTLGGHIDHHLVRQAAEQLGNPLYFYADYPYAAQHLSQLENVLPVGSLARQFSISEQSLAAWQEAVACHESQISTFWGGIEEMKSAIKKYKEQHGGTYLWYFAK